MPHKQLNFDVVPVETIAHLMDFTTKPKPKTGRRKILSISYDRTLSTTRGMILAAAGYEVRSVLGLETALAQIGGKDFDLIVMGHSIPLEDQSKILRQVRKSTKAPILVLWKIGPEKRLDTADYQLEASEGPLALLNTVRRIFSDGDGSARHGDGSARGGDD